MMRNNMKKITTVRGNILPNELGFTSMHDHTLVDLTIVKAHMERFFPPIPKEMLEFKPENFPILRSGMIMLSEEHAVLDDIDYMVRELGMFKNLGGNSLCDCSTIGGRGNINDIKKLSEFTGVNIIVATGLYTAISRPSEFMGKNEAYMISHFQNEINKGIDGSDIKPGFLKCALATHSPNKAIDESELTTVRACARLSAENGMSVHIHTAHPITGEQILQTVDMIINECGMQPEKIVICHMSTNLVKHISIEDYLTNPSVKKDINIELHEKLLQKGVNLGLDTWGSPLVSTNYFLPDDFDRLKALIALINKDYASQIVLGHDVAGKLWGRSYGNYGFTRIQEFVIPMLRQLNIGEDIINKLMIENPARILAY